MANRSYAKVPAEKRSGDASTLEALTRTLEELEGRLNRMATVRRSNSPVIKPLANGEQNAQPAAMPEDRPKGPSNLSEAVSQVAKRRQALEDEAAQSDAPMSEGAGQKPVLVSIASPSSQETSFSFDAMTTSPRPEPKLTGMRTVLDDLKAMIEGGADKDEIKAEIARVDEGLRLLADAGADHAAVGDLRQELAEMRELVGQTAREETLQSVGRRWDTLESKLESRAEEDAQAKRNLYEQLDELRASMGLLASEKSVRAVEERWDTIEERFTGREIEEKIAAMGARLGELEMALSKLPETLAIGPLEERVHALAVGVEVIARRYEEEDEADQFGQIEERLDEISRAIVAAASRVPTIDMSPVERVEARLRTLTARVDELAESGEATELQARIADLAARIDAAPREGVSGELTDRMERFSAQLDQLLNTTTAHSVIEERLDHLSSRLDAVTMGQVDDQVVVDLRDQIARLALQIENAASLGLDRDLEARLVEIERRIEENREDIAAVARCAADEAIRRMLETGDFRQSENVTQLSEDLRALEALSRESDAQTQDYFEAVHATLIRLVGRIDDIERTIVSGRSEESQAAPFVQADIVERPEGETDDDGPVRLRERLKRKLAFPLGRSRSGATDEPEVREAPSLDAADVFDTREADRPLAIGSGTPDIAALVEKVRVSQTLNSREPGEGRADFIAAARRAALAAAAEAENLRAGGLDDGKRSKFADAVSRRRKPVMMAIGAVLLAILALPAAKFALSDRDEASVQTAAVAPAPEADAPDVVPSASEADTDVSPSSPAMEPERPNRSISGLISKAGMAPASEGARSTGERTAPASASTTEAEATLVPVEQAAVSAPANSVPSSEVDATDVEKASAEARRQASPDLQTIPEVPGNIANAALTAAARDGNPIALFEVGLRLMEGRNNEADPAAAATWFELSADRGYAPAQYSLGTLYEKGNGVERDTAQARDWYLQAAENGNVRAMHNLAVLLATGVDGKSEPKAAAEWFEKGASHGMNDSQYNLGILYARGAGVEPDLKQSYKWFAIVADQGDADAARKRDEVAESLSESDLKAAKEAAAAFAPAERDEAANIVDIPDAWKDPTDAAPQTSSIDMRRAVRNVQAILTKLGYEPGVPDGIAGEKTIAAIRDFQRQAGLEPTGEIDEPLIRALLAKKDS